MTLTFDAFRIGTTFGNLALLPTYGLVGPRATTPSYSMPVELASGVVKNLGWLQCQWEWTYLDQAMYTILRVRFPSQSGSVYITTFDDTLAWINYLAIYRVQAPLPMADAGRRIQIAVSFVNMVVVTS
jgi:hypothetical protein